jgi:hypothetical protein
MSSVPHSDLPEVAPNRDLPEAHQKYAHYAPETYHTQESYLYPDTDTHKVAYSIDVKDAPRPATICGLKRRSFWIAAIVAAIVVVAAVGGGIGGALASRSPRTGAIKADSPQAEPTSSPASSSSSASSSSVSAPSPTLTPTPTSAEPTTSITTTTIVGPSSSILRDCPSANDTIYDVTLGDTKMSFRKECEISIVSVKTNANAVVKVVPSLNDCINLCAAYNINNRTRIAAGTDNLCNSVCWRNTFDKSNDWAGGMCFGFTTQNTTSGAIRYKLPAETRCDSAIMINQPF